MTGKHHALEVISGFLFLTTGNLLRAETVNGIGFIGRGQPRIGLTRGDGNLWNDNNKGIIRIVVLQEDLIPTACPSSLAAGHEEWDVLSEIAKCLEHLRLPYLLTVQAMQSQHRDRRVRAAPAKPGP